MVVFWRLDGVVSALLRSRLSKLLYLALYGAGVSGGGPPARLWPALRPSPPTRLSSFFSRFVASIQPLRAVLTNLALQAAASAARRRLLRDAASSRHMAKTTKTRVYEDVYEYQQLRRLPPQPLLNNRNNLAVTLHSS